MPEAAPEDGDFVAVTIYVPTWALTRFRWEAMRRSKPTRPVSPFDLVASAVAHIGRQLPDEAPAPAGQRPNREVRDESRARRGGVGAYTEAVGVVPRRGEA